MLQKICYGEASINNNTYCIPSITGEVKVGVDVRHCDYRVKF